MELRKPLAWFIGVAAGLYEPVFPVWLVDEEPAEHQFVVALDRAMEAAWQPQVFLTAPDEIRRREYAEAVVRRRLHQPEFRRRVLTAYGQAMRNLSPSAPGASGRSSHQGGLSGWKARRLERDRDVCDPSQSL